MFKKLFIMSALTLLCSSITAVNAAPYIGFNVAENLGSWQMRDYNGNNNKASARGSMATLFIGYGELYRPPIYFGGELFANTTATQSGTKTINNITGTIKQTYSYGVSALPGVMLGARVMAYGRLGYVRTRFKVRTNTSGNNTVLGTQFGLGLQGCVSDRLDLRGEYTYTNYRSLTAFNTTFNPHNAQYSIGVVYKLD